MRAGRPRTGARAGRPHTCESQQKMLHSGPWKRVGRWRYRLPTPAVVSIKKFFMRCLRRSRVCSKVRSTALFGRIVAPIFQTVAPIGLGDVAVGTLGGVSFDVVADFLHVSDLFVS